jgi:hypothetical protein
MFSASSGTVGCSFRVRVIMIVSIAELQNCRIAEGIEERKKR